MQPRPSIFVSPVIFSVLTTLAACSDDKAGDPVGPACTISERVRLTAPPESWAPGTNVAYQLHSFPDFVLYSFADTDNPERLYWRLDPCTGETTPFPSLAPGLHSPFLVDTPAGRVLYAKMDDDYYVVDRVDDPADDEPRKITGLPRSNGFDFNLWNAFDVPYALFHRDGDLYSHDGKSTAPAVQIAGETRDSYPYPDGVLVADNAGELRLIDPLTGASEVLLTGSQRTELVYGGESLDEAQVLWQPSGESVLHLRRMGEGTDLALAIDPAVVGTEAVAEAYALLADRRVLALTDPLHTRIGAAFDTDTGAAIAVPEHIENSYVSDHALRLILADGDTRIEAIWEPGTGAVREWYRGPQPVPDLKEVEGDHADYFVRDPALPSEGTLWRVDLDSGERRQLLARMSSHSIQVDTGKYLMQFYRPSPGDDDPPFDVEYVDVATANYTLLAGSVAAAVLAPAQRFLFEAEPAAEARHLLYLDAHGEEPGVWATPLP